MNKVLVCGGAGYIGSHMVRLLLDSDIHVVALDDFSTGHRKAVEGVRVVHGDVGDHALVDSVLGQDRFDAVMHFCARSLVGESVKYPLAYYQNNVASSLILLEAMQRHGVERFVFSSTAAVYGRPQQQFITEQHPTQPINPYGQSKLMIEQVLSDMASAHGFRAVALRYFNAAGAHPGGRIGESHQPETHLIPNILRSLLDNGKALSVFGDDYETPDGTCVRDYVHVDDLARAHLAALDWMDSHRGFKAFNLGNGQGFSVLQIIDAARRVTGKPISYCIEDPRAGDPPTLVASARLAEQELDWRPEYQSIEDIIETSWKWHLNPRY